MSETSTETKLYRRGLGLKAQVAEPLRKDYKGLIVDFARQHGFTLLAGEITFRLAKEFGFCYGVDRAVEYAYEARNRFPDKRIFITGEIIHNPYVNRRLEQMGILFLEGDYGTPEKFAPVTADDVVLLPAFGVSTGELAILESKGTVLVDTTCGSVMNVWKNVERYASHGFTSIVHGKHWHEETKATVSRATSGGGHYLVVFDMEETELVREHIERGGSAVRFVERFEKAISTRIRSRPRSGAHRRREPDDDAEHRVSRHRRRTARIDGATIRNGGARRSVPILRHHLQRDSGAAGCGIGALRRRRRPHARHRGLQQQQYGSPRRDLRDRRFPTFHIADSDRLVSRDRIRHKPIEGTEEVTTEGWLPEGALKVGITAGASTPDVKVDESIERVLQFRGLTREALRAG